MKLRNLLDVFQPKDLASDQATLQRDFGILRSYLGIMFPFDVDINVFMTNFKKNQKETNHPFVDEFLPFHTHDQEWLAKYLYKLVKDMFKKDKKFFQHIFLSENNEKKSNKFYWHKQPVIKYEVVRKFVETNEFCAARDIYEEDFTRALIDYTINNAYPQISQQEENIDEIFRQKIISKAQEIGINPRCAISSLEKNTDLWLQETMTDAFYNRYTLIPFIEKRMTDRFHWDQILNQRENFKEIWLQKQLYQYYQYHKITREKLGLAIPKMKISENNLKIINEQIAGFEDEYQNFTGKQFNGPNSDQENSMI